MSDDKCQYAKNSGHSCPICEPKKPSTASDCPRCGDMFYDPKTIIADYRQHAEEWEEIAKKARAEALEEAAQIAQTRGTWAAMEMTAWMGLPEKKRLLYAKQIGDEVAQAIKAAIKNKDPQS